MQFASFNSYGPISYHLPLYFQLESYLLRNQEEYFEFSSRNYTPEQRQYNNSLTQGLLDLASEEGYVFEEFTFSMVRGELSQKIYRATIWLLLSDRKIC